MAQIERVSALHWFPRIQAAGLPVPETVVVPYSHPKMYPLFDGIEVPEFGGLCEEIGRSLASIGTPAFLRTDLACAKHDGPRAYKIDGVQDVPPCAYRTIEDNELKFTFSREYPRAMLVRHFLCLDAPFHAFGVPGSQHPIAREWRLFAGPGGLICKHPYWPAASIEERRPSRADWRELLADLHTEPREMRQLEDMAVAAARVCEGEWSVDFCRDAGGAWWLLDMAPMAVSFHWPGCTWGSR